MILRPKFTSFCVTLPFWKCLPALFSLYPASIEARYPSLRQFVLELLCSLEDGEAVPGPLTWVRLNATILVQNCSCATTHVESPSANASRFSPADSNVRQLEHQIQMTQAEAIH